MLAELEKMSLMFDFLPRSQAEKLIKEANRWIAVMLRAYNIDVLWKKEAKGGIILEPFTWVVDSFCLRGAPQPYQIPSEIKDDGQSGLWTYVYRTGEDVWLEDIQTMDLKQPVINKANGQPIDPKYLYIWTQTDCFMATPLIFRDTVQGVYCIELPKPRKLNKDILDMMRRLAKPIATLIWKAEAHELNSRHTTEVVEQYVDSIHHHDFEEMITPIRTGFIARSFEPEFTALDECISKIMAEHQILAQHYKPQAGQGNIVEAIKRQIRSSHFGIVDITGNNPNVMLELGMMKMLGKDVLILRRKGDPTEMPFDIYNDQYYTYEVIVEKDEPTINIWNAGENTPVTIEKVVDKFVNDLYENPRFVAANPYRTA